MYTPLGGREALAAVCVDPCAVWAPVCQLSPAATTTTTLGGPPPLPQDLRIEVGVSLGVLAERKVEMKNNVK